MNYKNWILILLLFFGIFYSYPTIFNTENGKKINLGLDLQGGLYLLLDVDTDMAVKNNLKSVNMNIKRYSEKKDILLENLQLNKNTVTFRLLDEDDITKMISHIKNIEGIKFVNNGNDFKLFYSKQYIDKLKKIALSKTIKTIRNRLNQYGLSEPTVSKKGEKNILIELPGIKTPEEEQRARELISKTAKLEILEVDEDNIRDNMTYEYAQSKNDILIPNKNMPGVLLVKEIPILTGDMINDANVAFDKSNKPSINFSLNSEGADIFGDFTTNHIGKRTAIVLDGENISAPYIRSRIGGGHVQITGNYDIHSANSLAIALKSGALSANVKLLEKRSVGPSLGADSIKDSLYALAGGFILVFLFMLYYYRLSGLFVNIALIVNLLVIIAIMTLFGATLTLPGMAGIVLTVGMAVDTNVIIIERIKELIKQGKTMKKAIEEGYDKATTSILDANITTFIAAILLYAYGTGSVKGFAITLVIGISVSMITGIIGTKGMYEFININRYNRKTLFNLKENN